MTKIIKAVIPAAGLGTRFLPLTKAQPKEMLPVVNKPTIQWVIEEAVDAGGAAGPHAEANLGEGQHAVAWVQAASAPARAPTGGVAGVACCECLH